MIAERRVVVSGRIAGETRDTAEAKLRAAGALVQKAVNKETDILVIGDNVGEKKRNAALAQGIEIVPWEQAFRNSGATTPVPPPRAPMPDVHQWAPMLCRDGEGEIPAGGNWLYEIKWDGIRGVVTRKNGEVSIQSRSALTDLTNRYPYVTEELAGLPHNCVLDGELVQMGADLGFLPDGCDPSPVARFVAFDILEYEGSPTVGLPLSDRRELLHEAVPGGCYVAVSPSFPDGQALLDFVTEHSLEGIVAKQTDSRYIEDGRGGQWLKIKVRVEQEFVVVGYTPGAGARAKWFGALILGYYGADGEIAYAGKVGTGWDEPDLDMLLSLMKPLVTGAPDDFYESTRFPKKLLRDSFFLKPELVVQVAFQRWTDDDVLWHPSYRHVREDKLASDVVRET